MGTVASGVAPELYYAKGPNARRRRKGGGSVYFRSRDGLWMGYLPITQEDGTRKRKHVGSTRYCETLKKLRTLRAEVGAPALSRLDSPQPRMTLARAAATHTDAEWAALYLESRGLCFYCGNHANPPEKDHKVPIYRGGSDGIDNIAVSCAPCNRAKHTLTADEFAPGIAS
ncbi:HNH endonuclease signature motif containing protein [Nocardia rhamnosiphila]|uniref:HNH endonuclease signature motif containing protein n=1 Tax=Nocardia rhamnosiphila TaxID=426716 RepID=UPI0034033EF9